MLIKHWKKEIFTVPNLLSMVRLLLIPVYVFIYTHARDCSDYILAAAILSVSCFTDLVDGKIARHFNMVSTLGKILDPLADKATQFSLIICLTTKYSVLWYLVALFIIKESFQLVAGGINLHKGKMLKGALLSGKVCTTVLFVSLIFMILLPGLSNSVVNLIAVIDAAFMLLALSNYIFAYFFNSSKFQNIDISTDKN